MILADFDEITSKKCSSCLLLKPASPEHFHRHRSRPDGFRAICKVCRKHHRDANLDEIRASQRRSYSRTKERYAAYQRKRWQDPEFRAKALEVNKTWHSKNADLKRLRNQAWRDANPDKIQEYNRAAYAKDSLRHTISGHISYCLRRAKSSKARRRFQDLLGYSLDTLKTHIEKQFLPEMNWGNHGSFWELDHIVAIASFDIKSATDPEFKAAWALTNLRPLEKRLNRSKGARRLLLL